MSQRINIVPGVVIYPRASGVWWIDIHQNHKRVRRSLKVTSKAKALTLAHALAEEIVNQEWNVAVATTLTLENAIEQYRTSKSNHAEGTRDNVSHILGRFQGFLKGLKVLLLDRIRVEHVEAFRDWAKALKRKDNPLAPPVSPTTVRNWLQKVSMFFKWALDRGYIRRNPARGVHIKVPAKPCKSTLSSEEMTQLASACSPILGDLVRLLANTGLRIGEALSLKAEDFNRPKAILRVHNTKAERYDEMRVNKVVVEVLQRRALQSRGGFLFQSANESPLERRNIRRDLIEAGKKLGLNVTGPHQLRRSYCTALAPLVSTAVLQKMARHRDPRTTMRYYVNLQADAPPVVAS